MKKILSLTIIVLLLSVFVVFPKAEASETVVDEPVAEETVVDEAPMTVTETIVAWFYDNSSNIFTGASTAVTLVLAYLFKKGLLPSLTSGLTKMNSELGSGINNVAAIAEAFSQSTNAQLQEMGSKIEPFLEKARTVEDISSKMETALVDMQSQIDSSSSERAAMSIVLQMQTDFLYSVFMSANLPEYQKQQMGERYNEMKKVIDTLYQGEKNEEAEQ